MDNITIGTKLIGKENNGYGIANQDCLIEVTDISPSSVMFDGIIVAHKDSKYSKKVGEEIQNLRLDSFRLATEYEIEEFINKANPIKEKASKVYKFKSNLTIKTYSSGKIVSTFNPSREETVEFDPDRISDLNNLIEKVEKDKLNKSEIAAFRILSYATDNPDFSHFSDIFNKDAQKTALNSLINFFIEFQFEPNFRFVNSLAWKIQNSVDAGKEYIENYFKLTASPYVTAIQDKIKSPEFKSIISALSLSEPSTVVNARFKVYYGSQGTGKTTLAMKETDGRCIVCNKSMLPQDLMEDFEFDDGKPGFKTSILRECMTEGKGITLDEINLLPFETIRFLQGILDGKKEFTWKGKTVTIADGFNVIGTMNLMVNGMAFGLPEPLVDRCSDIKESKLTADDLLSTLF